MGPVSTSSTNPVLVCIQGKATTREWDLNRPDALQLEAPARLGDEDPRCGPASLQKFSGEDLTVSFIRGQQLSYGVLSLTMMSPQTEHFTTPGNLVDLLCQGWVSLHNRS